MEAAADRLDFESAAAIRDKIYALEKEESWTQHKSAAF